MGTDDPRWGHLANHRDASGGVGAKILNLGLKASTHRAGKLTPIRPYSHTHIMLYTVSPLDAQYTTILPSVYNILPRNGSPLDALACGDEPDDREEGDDDGADSEDGVEGLRTECG